MTKDEEIRINATLAELQQALVREHGRSADLAAECASLRFQLEEQKKEKPKLEAVE